MARIKTIRPIESISGKLKKSDNVSFSLRKATKKNFTVTRDNWTNTISAAKIASVRAHRQKFAAVGALARDRMADPTKRAVDEVAFKAQSKYTTLFGYLFHEEWMSYEE